MSDTTVTATTASAGMSNTTISSSCGMIVINEAQALTQAC